jgi:hypothetical protein
MTLHPDPEYQPIPVKDVIPRSLGTRSQRINPWIPSDQPATTICSTEGGYELNDNSWTPIDSQRMPPVSFKFLACQSMGVHDLHDLP